MKNKKLIVKVTSVLFILELILPINSAIAQTPEQNQLKYWYYRDRLLNDFMTCVCYENGGSLPASYRNNQSTPAKLNWGDGTIDLAYYIGVLALERTLLHINKQNTDETDKELFYAIEAINRLDLNADSFYQTGTAGEGWLNGFISRTDIGLFPETQTTAATKVNAKNPNPTAGHPLIGDSFDPSCFSCFNNSCNSCGSIGSETLNSYQAALNIANAVNQWNSNTFQGTWFDFTSYIQDQLFTFKGNTESKDQIIHLIAGLSLVIRVLNPSSASYVENGAVKPFMDGETTFVEEAEAIIDRFINYLHHDGFVFLWKIYFPGTDDVVPRGWNAIDQAQGFRYAQLRMTGTWNNGNSGNAISLMWENFAIQAWDFQHSSAFNRNAHGENSKWMTLDAVGHSRGNTQASEDLGHWCSTPPYYYEYLPLLHKALYPTEPLYIRSHWSDPPMNDPKGFIEDMLNQAPCYGPYNYSVNGNANYPNYEWSSASRLIHSESRGKTTDVFPLGDFNGLDYMLYHNLYYYIFRENLPTFNKLTRAVEITDYPFTNSISVPGGHGSHQSPVQITSFNTIEASNKIHSDGDVTYRASTSVTLDPGFEVVNGADFEAYIDPVDCSTGVFLRESQPPVGTTSYLNSEKNKHTSLDEYSKTDELLADVFPNPFSSDFTFYVNLQVAGKVTVILTDVIGKEISMKIPATDGVEGINEINVDSRELPNGIYILKASSGNLQKTIKLIKSN